MKPSNGLECLKHRKPNSDHKCLQQSRVYCRVPSKGVGYKPQVHSNLVFELGGFYKSLVWWTMTQGVCWLILLWRNNLSLYINNVVNNSNFSTLMML